MRNLLNLILLLGLSIKCGQEKKAGGDSPTPVTDGGKSANGADQGTPSDSKLFRVIWNWESEPKAETKVRASFTLSPYQEAVPSSFTQVEVEPWMPSMGHGTYTDEQKLTPIADRPGAYQVEGLYFIMGGPWEIKVSASLSGIRDVARIRVNVE